MPIAPMITWWVWMRVASLMMGRALKAKVQKTCRADQHQNDIVPRHEVDLHMPFLDGVGQKTDEDDHRQERGKARLGQTGEEQRHADAVQAECNHEDADNPALPALPDAGVGLTVILRMTSSRSACI